MIGFRVDSNKKIGMGHLMRCIAIAKVCEKKGMSTLFILADNNNVEVLINNQLNFCVMDTDWQNMNDEVKKLSMIIENNKIKSLVVDSYYVTDEYLKYVSSELFVLYVDDSQNDEHTYPVSALLHYNQFPDDIAYERKYRNTKTQLLMGFEYIPLREEFENVFCEKREKSIMFTTGSTDPYNVMGNVIEKCLKNDNLREYNFHVILGAMNNNEGVLNDLSKGDDRIILHKNVTNMSKYMKKCEMAVSAGGTTLYELCACKIPIVAFSFVDNQVEFTKKMGEKRILKYVGDVRNSEGFYDELEKNIVEMIKNKTLQEEYASNMSRVVDGQGCERISNFFYDIMRGNINNGKVVI